eukprot:6143798-Ditylum_brightwellii.AAC.1
MHGQEQHNLDKITLFLYDNFNPLFDIDCQVVDYLHFACRFGITVHPYGGGPIYFVYGQNKHIGQLFLAATEANNHHTI